MIRALVTGGSGTIGAAICRHLALAGGGAQPRTFRGTDAPGGGTTIPP